jgi:hypothetical protein
MRRGPFDTVTANTSADKSHIPGRRVQRLHPGNPHQSDNGVAGRDVSHKVSGTHPLRIRAQPRVASARDEVGDEVLAGAGTFGREQPFRLRAGFHAASTNFA